MQHSPEALEDPTSTRRTTAHKSHLPVFPRLPRRFDVPRRGARRWERGKCWACALRRRAGCTFVLRRRALFLRAMRVPLQLLLIRGAREVLLLTPRSRLSISNRDRLEMAGVLLRRAGPQNPRAEETVMMCPRSRRSISGRNSLTV